MKSIMNTIHEKVEQVDSLISPRAALASRGLLDARRIRQLTKHDLLGAVLALRARSILDNSKKKIHYTIGIDNTDSTERKVT